MLPEKLYNVEFDKMVTFVDCASHVEVNVLVIVQFPGVDDKILVVPAPAPNPHIPDGNVLKFSVPAAVGAIQSDEPVKFAVELHKEMVVTAFEAEPTIKESLVIFLP